MRVFEARIATFQINTRIGCKDIFVFSYPQFLHARLLLRDEGFAIHDRGMLFQACKWVIALQMRDVRRSNEYLGWDTADIDAGAADFSGFNHGHHGTGFRGANRCRKSAGAAADDGNSCRRVLVAAGLSLLLFAHVRHSNN